MENKNIYDALKSIVGIENILIDDLMKNHTSFKIGGKADYIVMPSTSNEIVKVVKLCNESNMPITVIGNGSNLIVREKGIRGVVVKLLKNFSGITVHETTIEAQSGILLSKLAKFAYEMELAGFEFASGIPGTLGGAVTMNAGAYGVEMKDVVEETEYIDINGNIKRIFGKQHQFDYRNSFIKKEKGIALWTKIKLRHGKKPQIKVLMDELNGKRKSKQPLEMPSAGSVFKRPQGHFAGKLIEDSCLKGYKIGGAEVSTKHCGFIVNSYNATADDVLKLIKHIQDTVNAKFGILLETEVRIIGEE